MKLSTWRARPLLVALLAVVVVAAGIWWWLRPRRWDDSAHPPPPVRAAIELYGSSRPREAEQALRKFLLTWRAPSWEARARLLAASQLLAHGRAAEIPSVLTAPLDPREPLAAHAELLRARGLLASSRWDAAIAAAARAASAPGFPGREEALRCQASALESKGANREALALLDKAGTSPLRLEAARTALRHSDRDGARRRLAALILDGQVGDDAERALDTLETEFPDASTRFSPSERPRVVAAARGWQEAGRTESALELLDSARPRSASPSSLTADEALLEADLLIRLGRVAAAEAFVARAAGGAGATADGARYLRARIELARGRASAHRAGLLALASARGASRWRLQALADLARIEEGAPSEAALRAYQRYRAAAGGAVEPGLLWREAWSAYDLGRDDLADAAIARVLARDDAPSGVRAAALYWASRREERRGHDAAARSRLEEIVSHWPNHYYGMLAARRLRLPPPEVQDRDVPPSPDPTSPDSLRWLLAARQLRSIGLWDAAAAAYRASSASAGGRARSVALEAAAAAVEERETADAVQLVLLAVKDRDSADLKGLPRKLLRLIVPAQDPERLAKIAREAKLDPAVVAGVVLQESAFNPLAVSSAGARGLLQLMPATAEEVARRIGFSGFRQDRLFEPETNLTLGCAHLRDLLERLGTLQAALAAYHAGASRAARWSAPGDDPEGERYIERIPIPDTRGYVKRIFANTRLYRITYPEGLGSP